MNISLTCPSYYKVSLPIGNAKNCCNSMLFCYLYPFLGYAPTLLRKLSLNSVGIVGLVIKYPSKFLVNWYYMLMCESSSNTVSLNLQSS